MPRLRNREAWPRSRRLERNRDEDKDKPKAPAPAKPDDSADRIREALDYRDESRDPRRTIVERYLNSRGLELDPGVAGSVIRFNARIKAMVSLMRNITTGEPQAVLRTYLDDSGRKRKVFDREGKELGERLFNGPTSGAAVMLDPFNSVTDRLVIGEGVETCLTGRQKGMGPSWALGSCGEIKKFPVLDSVRSLTIHRERCERNAEASEICAARWIKVGRQVFDAWPKVGKDINDAVRELESVGEYFVTILPHVLAANEDDGPPPLPPPIDANPYDTRGRGSDDAAVIDPRAPYDNARLFQASLPTPLRHHRGGFYQWDGSSWPEAGDDKLRARLYAFLDGCQCKVKVKDEYELRPVKPNALMVGGVLDALRAAAHLDATIEPPAWIDGVSGPPAHEIVACANGLLHLPTLKPCRTRAPFSTSMRSITPTTPKRLRRSNGSPSSTRFGLTIRPRSRRYSKNSATS